MKRILSLFLAILMLLSSATLLFSCGNKAENESGTEDEVKKSTQTTVSSKNEKYLVREYHGNIGVFGNDGTLIRILSVAVITLPLEEREKLKNGFYVGSDEMLKKVIEDYTG